MIDRQRVKQIIEDSVVRNIDNIFDDIIDSVLKEIDECLRAKNRKEKKPQETNAN